MSIRKRFLALALVVAALVGLQAQSISVPNTFVNGTAADADAVNANFTSIAGAALNRAAGTMTGVLQLSSGLVGAPSLTFSTDTTTGWYRVGAGSVGLALAGTQRWRLDSSGLTVYGTTIIDTNGKIPALSSTYFTSIDGSALTGLNATNIASGTLSNSRLTGVALLGSTNTYTARNDFLTYTETRTAPAISAGTLTVDLSLGTHFSVALNANITTLTISNAPASGKAGAFTLAFTADGTLRTITWPASVKWPAGTAPVMTSTNTKVDLVTLITYNGGTTWYGFVDGQNF